MESSAYNGPSNEKWILSQWTAMSKDHWNFDYNHNGIKFDIETGKGTGVRPACHYKHNKQWQRLNLYGHFIQMAGNLRRWRVHTLTDHLVFSFQGKVFIAGNKQGGWGVLKFREDQVEETAPFLSWRLAGPRDGWSSVPLWNTMAWMPPLVPRQCPRRSAVSPGARVGLICSFSNKSFNIYITC